MSQRQSGHEQAREDKNAAHKLYPHTLGVQIVDNVEFGILAVAIVATLIGAWLALRR